MSSSPVRTEESDAIVNTVIEKLREETGLEPDSYAIIDELNRGTVGLINDGKYSSAEQIAHAALELAERALGKEHSDTLTSLNNLVVRQSDNLGYWSLFTCRSRKAGLIRHPNLSHGQTTSCAVICPRSP